MGSYGFEDMVVESPSLVDNGPNKSAFQHQSLTPSSNFDREFGGFSPATSPVKDNFQHSAPALSGEDLDRWGGLPDAPYSTQNPQKTHPMTMTMGNPFALSSAAISQFGQVTPPMDHSPPADPRVSANPSPIELNNRQTRQTGASPDETETRTKSEGSSRRRKSAPRKSNRKASTASNGESADEKRSKFLERNRVAASKCRQKKKEWTENLEAKHREQQSIRRMLVEQRDSAKQEVLMLKDMLLTHSDCHHPALESWLSNSATHLAEPMNRSGIAKFEPGADSLGFDYGTDGNSPDSTGPIGSGGSDMGMIESALVNNLGAVQTS
ncbi:MAG: hypothetical protein Q9227_002652 [Pyrenula ochraceoflavens]